MILTGKCKEDFEKWYQSLEDFYHLELMPNNMVYGVIVDFSETVKDITQHDMVEMEQGYIAGGHTRPEARTFTVEKFNKRYNQNI